jgi:hypothetical protein
MMAAINRNTIQSGNITYLLLFGVGSDPTHVLGKQATVQPL